MSLEKTKGVLLIALGHTMYGRMAYTLAASLKATTPEIPIHLVFSGTSLSHLNQVQLEAFDSISEAPYDCYHRNDNLEYIKAKTWMYELSPFDITIFLDVDMIWLQRKPIASLFNSLEKFDYTVQNRDYIDLADPIIDPKYSQWANVVEIRDAYGFTSGRYYSLHSEFIYFKKCESNKKFFDEWRHQYDHLKVEHTVFGNGIPDELPLSIATVIHEKYPHEEAYLPIYWARAEQEITRTEMTERFYGYSIGGNNLTEGQKKTYNDLAAFYANRSGIRTVFKADSKTKHLTERTNF